VHINILGIKRLRWNFLENSQLSIRSGAHKLSSGSERAITSEKKVKTEWKWTHKQLQIAVQSISHSTLSVTNNKN